MTCDFFLAMAGFLTLCNIGLSLFISLVSGCIVYSWWRGLAVSKQELPMMLQKAIHDLAAQYMEPLAEEFDEKGKVKAEPNKPNRDEILLEDDFKSWLSTG